MILVDANILLYAADENSPQHEKARRWWDAQLSNTAPVCLCWPVITAFIRIATNRGVFARPLSLAEAISAVESWLGQPCVCVVHSAGEHWQTLKPLLEKAQAVGNLVTDAHIAAIAVDNGCEICSTDSDFSRFAGLRWRNPLA